MSKLLDLKHQIHSLIKEYHEEAFKEKAFVAGESAVAVSGKVFDHTELQYITDAALDGWFTTGKFNTEFEKKLAKYINVKSVITVNSGSSANLVAFATLTAKELGDEAITPGDEVITVAASFPTTVNPIVQYGAIPVFLDVELPTYQIDITHLEKALSTKTKAVVVAHTLGNTFNLDAITAFCDKHNLWLLEDCCDALGAKYKDKHVGTFGDIATLSFYPAHHITMGEGGAVFTSNAKLKTIAESFRDWGRDCWCEPGKDNTCGKRFSQQLGDLPMGYDHKYTYSRIGYNLKITDMQAALGLAQLQKLDSFIEARKRNFNLLSKGLAKHSNKLILPRATEHAEPSWFGFLITVKEKAGISRNDLVQKLHDKKIATRLLFAGDLRKQPYFKNVNYRVVGDLINTEIIVNNTFWIGVTPMISEKMIEYVCVCFDEILV
ncbi:MAG TPA: lipopolysaccharide biosynthesis protein RfbH [Bacteroidia bacterium]